MSCRKLIACDIDGTLLNYGETELSEEVFELIRALKRKGVQFCTASGRQYHSLRKLFGSVADEITYMCENGAVVLGCGNEEEAPLIFSMEIPREDALAIAQDIQDIPGCEVLLSARNCYYVSSKSQEYIQYLEEENGALLKRVEDLHSVSEKIYKVSLINLNGDIQKAQKILKEKWKDYQVTISGVVWVDIALADKGAGVKAMCNALGIALKNCIAFGDNWNDVTMLETAGTGYLMSTADAELLKKFPDHCDSVIKVWKKMLSEEQI